MLPRRYRIETQATIAPQGSSNWPTFQVGSITVHRRAWRLVEEQLEYEPVETRIYSNTSTTHGIWLDGGTLVDNTADGWEGMHLMASMTCDANGDVPLQVRFALLAYTDDGTRFQRYVFTTMLSFFDDTVARSVIEYIGDPVAGAVR